MHNDIPQRWMLEQLEPRLLFAQAPFLGAPAAIPGVIEAENFDSGGENVAWHDTTASNLGGAYRDTSVDVQANPAGGYCVGSTAPGEWLEYTVKVSLSGLYQIDFRVAAGNKGGSFHLSVDGSNKTGSLYLPQTASWDTWTSVRTAGINLSTGTHVLKLTFDGANDKVAVGNIDWMAFTNQPIDFLPKSFSWKAAADMPLAREEAQTFAFGDKMYVVGGYYNAQFKATRRMDSYDPATNAWTRLPDAPYMITHAAVAMDGNIAWFIGGYVGDLPSPPATTAVWQYDCLNRVWIKGPPLPDARGAGGSGIIGRKLYYFGGADTTRTNDCDDTYVLNLDDLASGWTRIASMPNARNHLGGVAVNGKLYAIGGQHHLEEASVDQDEVDVFDPATNAWTPVAPLLRSFSHFNGSTVVYKSRYIITAGGEDQHGVANRDVYVYDTFQNKWADMTAFLPKPRRAAVATIIGNKLIVAGGYFRAEGQTKTTWIADLTNVLA